VWPHAYPSLEEQRARAHTHTLMNKPEACLPWEPIPACCSGNRQVDVTQVAAHDGEEATDVT
jgi:hypothetical protein